jgi:hypothetical protein
LEALAAEAAAAAAAATAAAGEGAEPPAPAEGAEQLKAKKDAAAVVSVWGRTIAAGNVGSQLKVLQNFVLPLPLPCLKLLYAVGLLINESPSNLQDVCGDPNWDVIKQVRFYSISFLPLIVVHSFYVCRTSLEVSQRNY